MTTTTTRSDADLVTLAGSGDLDALRAIVERHLHPAWRIATVAAGAGERAETATVEGIVAGLVAAGRQPEQPLRIRLVASTRQAATAAGASLTTTAEDPVVNAFLALPEKSRTALWLTEVEGGSPEQVAPVLGLDRSAAAALADRAALALRERLAADVAARASADDCRAALAKLPAHAAGKLTAAERAKVGEHMGGCGLCAVWLAALVAPRPALRRLVGEPPIATLTAEIEARWLEHLKRERSGWLAPFTERAIGAAAAAVLAIGLGGVALLGDRDDDDRDRRSELALPASVDPTGDRPTTTPTPPPSSGPDGGTTPTPTPTPSPSGPGEQASAIPAPVAPPPSTTTTTPPRPRGDDPTPPSADPTPPPSADPPPPAADDSTVQVGVQALQGLVNVGLVACTGIAIGDLEAGCVPPSSAAPLAITIDLPGLDPIGI